MCAALLILYLLLSLRIISSPLFLKDTFGTYYFLLLADIAYHVILFLLLERFERIIELKEIVEYCYPSQAFILLLL